MRKLLAGFASLILFVGLSMADTTTSRYGLTKPDVGSPNWGPKLNTNFDLIDNAAGITLANTFTNTNTFTGVTGFNAQARFWDGSASAPIISFSSATSLGLYRVTGNILGFTTAGAEAFEIGTSSVTSLLPIIDRSSGESRNVIVSSGSQTINGNLTVTGNFNVSASTITGAQISTLWGYRRPEIEWSSTNQINVETNTATSNSTTIFFPDGQIRTVTENLATTQNYRACKMSQTAQWQTGTIQGGIDSGVVASSTVYSFYAVKVTSAALSANFVIVASTITPETTNQAVLNSRFGTNAFVYLGQDWYGNGANIPSGLLNFKKSGNYTVFVSSMVNGGNTVTGVLLATTAGATSVTYTYAKGVSVTSRQIPGNIKIVSFGTTCAAGGTGWDITQQTSTTVRYWRLPGLAVSSGSMFIHLVSAADGLVVTTGSSTAQDIYLVGFIDNALGIGSNPQF